MKGIVSLILVSLLLSPGFVAAADRKAGQQSLSPGAVTAPLQKLDLNRATRDELVAIPGIGPRMAQAIVDLRLKKGSFTRMEDLLDVRGIKEKKLVALSAYLVVMPLQSAASAAPQSK